MKTLQRMIRIHRTLFATALLLLFLCTTGCAGDTIEYDPPDPRLIGKVIHFDEFMMYMLISEKDSDDFDKKSVEIGRIIMSKWMLVDQYSIFHEYPREYFKDNMLFTIIGSYWVRGDWFTREFAPDMHMVILEDENGILSVCSLRKIRNIKTNILGELQ